MNRAEKRRREHGQDAFKTLQRALDCLRNGDLKNAELLNNEALKDLGNHADALHLRGMIALHKGELQDAEIWIRKSIALQESRASFWSNLGLTLSKQERWLDAVSALQRALDLAPDSLDVLLNLGAIHEQSSDLTAAEHLYRRALVIAPEHVDALLKLAQVLHRTEQLQDARDYYIRLLERIPNHIIALNNAGNICFDNGDYENALKHYEKAILEDPESPRYRLCKGRCLECLGRDKEALKIYESALSDFPDLPETVLLLANAYMDQGNVGASRLFNQKALEIHPDSPIIINNYGHFLMGQEQYEEALSCFEKALTLDTAFSDAKHNRSKVLYKLNRLPELKECLKELLQEVIPSANTLILQAYVSYIENDLETFSKHVSLLRETAPFENHLRFFEALQHCAEHRYDKAAEPLKEIRNQKYLLLGKEILTLQSQVSEMVGEYSMVFPYAIQQKNLSLKNSNAHLDLLVQLQLVQLTFQKDWVETWIPSTLKGPSPSFLIRITDGTPSPIPSALNASKVLPHLINKMEAAGYEYPHGIAFLTPSFIEELVDEYWKQLGCTPQSVVDASDDLFLYLGLLYRLFPQAKIVLIQRDPFDTITNIITNPNVLFDIRSLEHAASFYSEVNLLLKQYQEALPLNLLVVEYDDIWSQNIATLRSMKNHLGEVEIGLPKDTTPFEALALEPGRWKKFANELDGYKTAVFS